MSLIYTCNYCGETIAAGMPYVTVASHQAISARRRKHRPLEPEDGAAPT